jgi:tRNA U38,U39,U40 pseudouridine synthase TruA
MLMTNRFTGEPQKARKPMFLARRILALLLAFVFAFSAPGGFDAAFAAPGDRPVATSAIAETPTRVSVYWTNAVAAELFSADSLPERNETSESAYAFVQRAESPDGPFATVCGAGSGAVSASIDSSACALGKTYYYRIVQKPSAEIAYSNAVSATIPLDRPAAASAVATSPASVSVYWTNAAAPISFDAGELPDANETTESAYAFVQRAESPDGPFASVFAAGSGAVSADVVNPSYALGKTYYFRIAQKVNTEFVCSNVVSATIPRASAGAASAIATSQTGVYVSWTNAVGRSPFDAGELPDANETQESAYAFVQRADSPDGPFASVYAAGDGESSVSLGGSSYILGKAYYFRIVQKVNTEFVRSDVVSATIPLDGPSDASAFAESPTRIGVYWTNAVSAVPFGADELPEPSASPAGSADMENAYAFIQRADSPDGPFASVLAAGSGAVSADLESSGYALGRTYYFRVAQKVNAEYIYSNVAAAAMPDFGSGELSLASAAADKGYVRLNWTNASARSAFNANDLPETDNSGRWYSYTYHTYIQCADSLDRLFATIGYVGETSISASVSASGLASNETYYFRIVQRANGVYTYSNVISVTMPDEKPVLNAAVADKSAIRLSWANADARSAFNANDLPETDVSGRWYSYTYHTYIQRADSAVGTFSTVGYEGEASVGAAISASGLVPNKTYYFRIVQRINGIFVYSNAIAVAMPDEKPILTSVIAHESNVFLNWSNANARSAFNANDLPETDASGRWYSYTYHTYIQRADSPDGPFVTRSYLGETSVSASVSASGLQPGETYYFRVVQRINGVYVYSNAVSVTMPDDKPILISAVTRASTLYLNWSNANARSAFNANDLPETDASGRWYSYTYHTYIQRAGSSDGPFATISYFGESATSATMSASALQAGMTYYFRLVQRVNGVYVYSNEISVTVPDDRPIIASASSTGTSVTLQWANASARSAFNANDLPETDASGRWYSYTYHTYIQRAASLDGTFTTISYFGELAVSATLSSGMAAGATYYFRIVQKSNGTFVYSNAVAIELTAGAEYSYRDDWEAGLASAELAPFEAAFRWNADWEGSPGDLFRLNPGTGEFERVAAKGMNVAGGTVSAFDDAEALVPGGTYVYKVIYPSAQSRELSVTLPAKPKIVGPNIRKANLDEDITLWWDAPVIGLGGKRYAGEYVFEAQADGGEYSEYVSTTATSQTFRILDVRNLELRLVAIFHGVAIESGGVFIDEGNLPRALPVTLAGYPSSDARAIELAWEESTRHVPVVRYRVYMDGELAGTTDRLSYRVSGVEYEGAYEFYVISVDSLGRFSDASNTVTVTAKEDEEPPTAPTGVRARSRSADSLTIEWNKSGDDGGVAKYLVYRDGALIGETAATAYTDAGGLVEDQVYVYVVVAADGAGNESEPSAPFSIKFSEKPVVTALTPADGAKVGLNASVFVSAMTASVNRIVKIELFCRARGAAAWTPVETLETGASKVGRNTTWDNGALEGGFYEFRAVATDDIGMPSEPYDVAWEVDVTPPAYAPELSAAAVGNSMYVRLEWADQNSGGDVVRYCVYRKASGDSGFATVDGGVPAEASYFNDRVYREDTYEYRIGAVDSFGNVTYSNAASAFVPYLDREAPVAAVGFAQRNVRTGETVKFDGSASSDNVGVTAYEWSIGGASYAGPTAEVVFDAPGEHLVRLTVSDAAGNTGAASGRLKVIAANENADYGDARVLVRSAATGAPLPNSLVRVETANGDILEQYSDAGGAVDFVLEAGANYAARAYRAGYTSAGFYIAAGGQSTVELTAAPVVIGDLSVERMTIEQIEAAGIDTSDPANQNLFRFTVVIVLDGVPEEHEVIIGGNGDINQGAGNGWAPMPIQYAVWPSRGSGSDDSPPPPDDPPPQPPNVAFIAINGEATWLKEMFDVQLTLLNSSNSETITECLARLDLPDGLSLAGMVLAEQSLEVRPSDILPGTRRDVHWYVRGDKEGEYDLSALFHGVAQPFAQDVELRFATREPIKIYGGKAMELYVTVDDAAETGYPYRGEFELRSVAPFDIYNLTLAFTGAGVSGDRYEAAQAAEQGAVLQESDSVLVARLSPGESVRLPFEFMFEGDIPDMEYRVRNMFAFTREGSNAEIPIFFELRHVDPGEPAEPKETAMSLSQDGKAVVATVVNDGSAPLELALIVATYDEGGRLIGSASREVRVEAESYAEVGALGIASLSEAASARAFLWYRDAYAPYAEAKTFLLEAGQ